MIPGTRGRAGVTLLGLTVFAIVGALIDRSGGGFERSYLSFLILLIGPFFWLVLAACGRNEPLPTVVLGFVLVAFSGLLRRPFASWGLTSAAIATFWLALPISREAATTGRAKSSEEAFVVSLGVGAYALLWAVANGNFKNYVIAGALALFALESWGPRSERTVQAASRRVSSVALLAASAMMYEHVRPDPIFLEPEQIFLVLGAAAVLTACLEAGG